MSALAPTPEQQAILDAFPSNHVLKINACAGSGKSSTLRMLSEANPLTSLYVCFNKANADEAKAKFPAWVACRTMHSLAYSQYGRMLQHKLSSAYKAGEAYVNKGRSNAEIVKLYGIPSLRTSEITEVTARATAGLVKLTVGRYQNSAHKHIGQDHIPFYELMKLSEAHPELDLEKYRKVILNFANKLWADRIDPNSPVQAEHDTYLKLWQLSEPILSYDVIYVDEAQDTNPVAFDILKNQKCKMVYVGDAYQSIYAFRQAVNAMEVINAPSYVLSKSFRYGQEIATLAKNIIRGGIDVKGFEKIKSTVGLNFATQYTKIFRTNSGLLGEAVGLIGQGVKVFANIDTRKFENQLTSCQALFNGDLSGVKDDDISLYSSWDELLEDAEERPEIKRLAEVVLNGLTSTYLAATKRIKLNKDSYDVLLTTAHKSKGMEWDYVVLADDFPVKPILVAEDDPAYNQQEVNLLYVAATRAIKNVQIPSDFQNAFTEYEEDMQEALEIVLEGCGYDDPSVCADDQNYTEKAFEARGLPVGINLNYLEAGTTTADIERALNAILPEDKFFEKHGHQEDVQDFANIPMGLGLIRG